MRVSLNWLKELVDVNLTPEELGKILTMAGFELKEIIDLRANAAGIPVDWESAIALKSNTIALNRDRIM